MADFPGSEAVGAGSSAQLTAFVINLPAKRILQGEKLLKRQRREGHHSLSAGLPEEAWLYNAARVKRGQLIYSLKGAETASKASK